MRGVEDRAIVEKDAELRARLWWPGMLQSSSHLSVGSILMLVPEQILWLAIASYSL